MNSSYIRTKYIDNFILSEINKELSNSLFTLEVIADICLITMRNQQITKKIRKNDVMIISRDASIALRSLFMLNLQGNQVENIHDQSFIYLSIILSSFDILSPKWTIEDDVDSKKSKGNDQILGNFSIFLCSIISVEIHLILQEITILFHQSNDFIDVKQANDVESNKNMSIKSIDQRQNRILIILPICLDLLNQILQLLLENDSDIDHDRYWSVLPASCLISIKEYVQKALKEIFDFIDWSSTQYKQLSLNNHNSITSHDSNHQIMYSFIRKCVKTVVLWVNEDESLYITFIRILPRVVTCSHIPVKIHQIDTSQCLPIVQVILGYQEMDVDDNKDSINVFAKSNLAIESKPIQEYLLNHIIFDLNQSSQFGDVLFDILPCILNICHVLFEDMESNEAADGKSSHLSTMSSFDDIFVPELVSRLLVSSISLLTLVSKDHGSIKKSIRDLEMPEKGSEDIDCNLSMNRSSVTDSKLDIDTSFIDIDATLATLSLLVETFILLFRYKSYYLIQTASLSDQMLNDGTMLASVFMCDDNLLAVVIKLLNELIGRHRIHKESTRQEKYDTDSMATLLELSQSFLNLLKSLGKVIQ